MINQFKATVTPHQQLQPQTCVQEHCPGETGLPSYSRFYLMPLAAAQQVAILLVCPIDSLAF